MKNFKYLLFDADDMLFDFRAAESVAFQQTMEGYRLDFTLRRLELYDNINSELWREIEVGKITNDEMQRRRFTEFLQAIGADGDGVEMNRVYLENLCKTSILYDGAAELVRKCAKKFTLAIVTNGIDVVQSRRLAGSEIAPHIGHLFISGVVGHNKPSPLFFDHVCREMGINNRADALIVGDSLSSDILGGNNSGIAACWYNPGGATAENHVARPDYTVHDYAELERLLGV